AKQAFLRKGWTQDYLAGEVGLETRQPIWKFFAGKPVARHVFIEICFQLDLDPEQIAAPLQETELDVEADIQPVNNDIDTLVVKVRQAYSGRIQDQCGTLRLLDISRPVALDDLYVEVNILEEITSQQWLELSDLQGVQSEEFDRLNLRRVRAEGVVGLKAVERYTKLMVLGKPGAGNTTFLQSLAVHCNQGEFQVERVPIFIRLNHFAEDALDKSNINLLNYIQQEFSYCDISKQEVEVLLNSGRGLILLDGLDEVPEIASAQVIQQIRQLAQQYYKNQIIITCRIAAKDYRFQGFAEVEIADFTPQQIENFVKKWFVAVAQNSPELGFKKASLFLEQMALPENQQIRELATTPILLNLICLVFQAKGNFPTQRSELYKQGLDLLLIRWDEARGIRRDEIYRNLSLSHKLQLLSQLALSTFEQGHYFFAESTLQQIITDYLYRLQKQQADLSTLEEDSIALMKSMEAQHGILVERAREIYSFSHLTFQEYLTARAIAFGSELSLQQLARHLTEKRWREVFLLTAQMSLNADRLLHLMQRQINAFTFQKSSAESENNDNSVLNDLDSGLHQFLNWVRQKSLKVKTSYKSAAVRAFYLALAFPPEHRLSGDQTLALAIDRRLSSELDGELALDLALVHALNIALSLTCELIYDRLTTLRLSLSLNHLTKGTPFQNCLEQLQQQLPNPDVNRDSIQQWCQVNASAWVSQLRRLIVEHRNIGHEWHLNEASLQWLEQYSNANQLLLECLNNNL
ncbi:MAG TPA: NACHT domain-containing NTPase, partial [Cyanophyceae cyanobacterium]